MSNLKTALTFIIGLAVGGGAIGFALPKIMGVQMGSQMSDDMAGMDHSKMGDNAAPAADVPRDSSDAYKVAMDKMMSDMMVPYTGNADVDFAKGMVPHHQGAIDMAKVVLQFGKDPEMRKLAEAVVAAQTSEIDFMRNWLKASGG